jgi:putative tryptophan/tyrosine transport system substrate-binding protein
MNRRALLALVGGGAVVWPLSAIAERPARMWRIGFLAPERSWKVIQQALRDLGYREGYDTAFEVRPIDPPERLAGFAAELVDLNVDVIVAGGSPAVRAAQQATTNIPIIMAAGGDPVGNGFIASLARPGGNITGLSTLTVGLIGKRLELLKEVVPNLSRTAVLRNPAVPDIVQIMKEIETAATSLAIEPQFFDVRSADGFERAFAAISEARPSALVVLPGPLMTDFAGPISAFALANRLPAVFHHSDFPRAGGLMSYGQNLDDMLRRAAVYVDKILKGAKPADLPVEQPTKFELVINLKTAKALGLTVPLTLQAAADKVIE